MGPEYKDRIYERYVSSRATPEWSRARDYYRVQLSRWLPTEFSSSILDLGCGQGDLLAFLLERGYGSVTGVDLSSEQAALARSRAPGAEIVEMDLFEFLADESEAYDCVTALDLIEHLEKKEVIPFLDLVYKALRPGGRLILQTPNAASPWGMAVRYDDFTHDCCFTPGALAQVLALAGFVDFQAQETGPVFRGIISSVRYVLWRLLILLHRFYNLVETGASREGVYTRVFQCSARKK
ncbi:MAG TPA: class I SAM-dependent methyltransferase [bacterium]|nr:class I SAM-dependent methyltransferase [bacterium]